MSKMTGSRALMEMLRAEGVDYIFGNPGTSESPIMNSLKDYPELKYMLVTQEGVAMGMADAYARATGRPAFVNLHIETGLANGISLLHNANVGGTPMVLSAGNKDIRELAHGRTDLAGMVGQFTKWSAEVTHPEAVPVALRRAFNEAKTPPTGPTFVAFSANSLDDTTDVDIVSSPRIFPHIAPDRTAVVEAAQLLVRAERPMVLVGDRVGQADGANEAVQMAELLGARVHATSYSEMNFPTSHPQFVSSIKLGFQNTKDILSSADVLLMVGSMSSAYYMLSEPVLRYFGPSTRLIHVDSDTHGVGNTQPTAIGIVADPKVALRELIDAVESSMSGSAREAAKGRAEALASESRAMRLAWDQRLKERWDTNPMSPERMMSEVAKAVSSDTIIVNDSVTAGEALHSAIKFDEPGSIYGARGGAIGWGMGAALGVKLANPNRPVVAVVGDGSAMMTVQALWTAANENIPVVYLICNNRSYRILKLNMGIYKSQILNEKIPSREYIGMDFPLPLDIAAMAEAMGVYGRKIEAPDDLAPAIRHALELGRPVVLDVIIDGST